MEFGLLREETKNKGEKKKVKEKNIFQSQKISFTSPNLVSDNCPPCEKISDAINAAKKAASISPHYDQHLTETLKSKLSRLKIISRLIAILNQESANSSARSIRSLESVQLD
jgi:hypothetical protein